MSKPFYIQAARLMREAVLATRQITIMVLLLSSWTSAYHWRLHQWGMAQLDTKFGTDSLARDPWRLLPYWLVTDEELLYVKAVRST